MRALKQKKEGIVRREEEGLSPQIFRPAVPRVLSVTHDSGPRLRHAELFSAIIDGDHTKCAAILQSLLYHSGI